MSCADVMKILADETRMGVVGQLLLGPKCVGDINAALKLEPTLLSHHLRIMREAGLVKTTRDGKTIVYTLSPSVRKNKSKQILDFGCCTLQFQDKTKAVL